MKDFAGHELLNGDKVAYATRRGSSLRLKQGTVTLGTGPYDGKLRVVKADTGRLVAIERLDHVVKLFPVPMPAVERTEEEIFGVTR